MSLFLLSLPLQHAFVAAAAKLRKKRLAEIKEAAKVLRFGFVVPISGSSFFLEVSQAPSNHFRSGT
ncbi:hypothetical protein HN51_016211 [Arachis hypogaea]